MENNENLSQKTKSNRIVVALDRKDMRIDYKQGFDSVYLHSYLTKEFVVRPTSPLQVGETLWVAFYKEGVTMPEPIMLALRKVTKANSTVQVTGESLDDIRQSDEEGAYEYYVQLPNAVLKNTGTWNFSLAIIEFHDNANQTVSFTRNGETYVYEDKAGVYEVVCQSNTSGIGNFTVEDSLAQMPDGTPNDKTIADLYSHVLETKDEVNASNYAPRISDDGYWEVYSKDVKSYIKTTTPAQGPQGEPGAPGGKGDTGEPGPAGPVSTVVSSATQFKTSTSGESIPSGQDGWSNTANPIKGQYVWSKTTTTWSSGEETENYAVTYVGKDGKDGVSVQVQDITIQYQASESGTTNPTSWMNGIPVVPQGGYLWTKIEVTYSGVSNPMVYYSVARQGRDGTSVSMVNESIKYAVGTSGRIPPSSTSTWTDVIPDVPQGQYLWSKTYVEYYDPSQANPKVWTTTYSVAYQGKDGAYVNGGTMNGNLTVNGNVTIEDVPHQGSKSSQILVRRGDTNQINYRSPSEVLLDAGYTVPRTPVKIFDESVASLGTYSFSESVDNFDVLYWACYRTNDPVYTVFAIPVAEWKLKNSTYKFEMVPSASTDVWITTVPVGSTGFQIVNINKGTLRRVWGAKF